MRAGANSLTWITKRQSRMGYIHLSRGCDWWIVNCAVGVHTELLSSSFGLEGDQSDDDDDDDDDDRRRALGK